MDQHNGNEDYELPMPATYVINKHREIIYSFIPEDYTERLDPENIIEILLKETSEVAWKSNTILSVTRSAIHNHAVQI